MRKWTVCDNETLNISVLSFLLEGINYYIICVLEDKVTNIGKLLTFGEDGDDTSAMVKCLFFKSEPLTNNLIFKPWGDPETTNISQISK